MLTTLILATVSLSNSGEAAPLSPRVLAASVLRDGLAELQEHDGCEHRFPLMVETADTVSVMLGESAFADGLRETVYMARWIALTRPGAAESNLERDLERALSDLEFEPLIEAELPEGFPEPTPVREIELKTYPVYRLARAEMEVVGENGAFWQLFQHIKKNDIPMTAPVEMTYDEEGEEIDMAFMYQYAAQGTSGPDGKVAVLDIEPMLVASLGCRGRSSQGALDDARDQLLQWISAREDLEVTGPMRQFGYNSPMVRNSRRYFEVQIPVRQTTSAAQVVIDFSVEDEPSRWMRVNDGVMGGLSTSSLSSTGDGTCQFSGNLSLENNGGFASVRSRSADLGLDGAKGLSVRVRGDGNTYKLRVRMNGQFDGVSYEVRFPTTVGEWTEASFEFDEFKPTWRGRGVPGAPELDPAKVRSVTFMISDKQAGSFRLELGQLAKF